MNHYPHPSEESLYRQARELTSRSEREAFLLQACAGDESLLGKMRQLLACDAEAMDGELLPTVVSGGEEHGGASQEGERPGATIGPYKLREQIGEGGFGTVWVADQEQPVRRRVALKIIKLGMDTKEVIARFGQERQALAIMDHPNIAKVLDAGTTENGRPYFVMELVRGVKITEFCDDQRLPMAERINLFITVCQAVQHAHQKGIIHRDLKPSNILVSLNDGKAAPKVIDFGIAKATQGRLTDGTIYTQFEQLIGTPLYMSPEQAQMTSLDIDTRSDIYSLGVLLYELLTGRTPIDTATMAQAGVDEIRRLIREVDPPRPSARVKTLAGEELTTLAKRRGALPAKVTSTLTGDLDWIVMRCLEKDRARRYDTANGLAMDLQRHLANEVVTARPPTTTYLLGKLIRRHRLAFAATTAIAASLVLGIAAATWMYFREREALKQTAAERDAKEQARKDAEDISNYLGDVFQSPDPTRDGREIKVVELLDNAARKLETGLATQPAQRAKLQAALGRSYHALGLARQAVPLLEKVRDYWVATFGPEHSETILAMHTLATSYAVLGRLDETLKLQAEVLTLSRKVNGPEHPHTLHAMNNLAISCVENDRRDEAVKLQKEVLALSLKLNGPEHPDTLKAMANLATFYGPGRRDEAIKLREEVLALSPKVNSPEHPDTLIAMANLAISYVETGRKDEAFQLREEMLTLSREVNGPEHHDTAKAAANLGFFYDSEGHDFEKSIGLWSEAVRINPGDANTQFWLGKLLFEKKRHQEAFAPLHAASELYPNGERGIEARQRLLTVLTILGRDVEAEDVRRALSALLPPVAPVVATLIPPESNWKWLHPTDGVDPATGRADFHTSFFAHGFDDSAWKTGQDSAEPNGGFGYGRDFAGIDIGKPENESHRHSAYFRHRFTTDKPHASLELRCQRDDALIVYLNGKEVLRNNLPAEPDTYHLAAEVSEGPENEGVVHRFPIPGTLEPGEHLLAISVHNTAQASSDLRLGGVTLVELAPTSKPK